MFTAAIATATQFTYPVITFMRRWDGAIGAGVSAFTVLNADGWIATAGHVFDTATQAVGDRAAVDALRQKIADAQAAPGRPAEIARTVQRLNLSAVQSWITNHTYWWSEGGVVARDLTIIPEADLAICRLDPFPDRMKVAVATLKDPTGLAVGTSLCRLGFPFSVVQATYDETTDTFASSGEVPLFPLDGIFTRTLESGRSADGKHPIRFLEVSTPGLRGQSGGPLFDRNGLVWGIQNRTRHLALDFNPEVDIGGRKTVVPQFINLGLAVHPETLASVLADLGVTVQTA